MVTEAQEGCGQGVGCCANTMFCCGKNFARSLLTVRLWCTAESKAAEKRAAAHKEAEAQKEEGNALFKAGAYEDAIKSYSRAIEIEPTCAVYYSNRAQAYLKVQWPHASCSPSILCQLVFNCMDSLPLCFCCPDAHDTEMSSPECKLHQHSASIT